MIIYTNVKLNLQFTDLYKISIFFNNQLLYVKSWPNMLRVKWQTKQKGFPPRTYNLGAKGNQLRSNNVKPFKCTQHQYRETTVSKQQTYLTRQERVRARERVEYSSRTELKSRALDSQARALFSTACCAALLCLHQEKAWSASLGPSTCAALFGQ